MRLRSILLRIALILAFAGFGASVATAAPATGPLRVHPGNPRYFTDDGVRAIYLTGSHTWANFQDRGRNEPPPSFDYPKYLEFMRERGHNFMRLWVSENARWSPESLRDYYVEPLPFLRTGPGRAIDGKPRFDLTRWNPAYFERLRERVLAARDRGIYVAVMLFNGWSVEPFEKLPGNPWLGHPFSRYNNVNEIDGDPNYDNSGREIHTMDRRLTRVRRLQEFYVKKVIDTVGDLDNVLWEIGNEIGAHSTEWQYHMIRVIKEYERGRPKQHPVGMTFQWFDGHNNALFNSAADWISPNETGGYKTSPRPADGRKVIVSDTDHLWGIGGNAAWVWKSFLMGLNPIYMDPYGDPDNPPADESIRVAMGLTARYAKKVKLAAMVPSRDIASSGYALVNPGVAYLVYVPLAGTGRAARIARRLLPERIVGWLPRVGRQHVSVTVDLSSATRPLEVEWCSPRTGETVPGQAIVGAATHRFTAPFPGDAVLYLAARTGS